MLITLLKKATFWEEPLARLNFQLRERERMTMRYTFILMLTWSLTDFFFINYTLSTSLQLINFYRMFTPILYARRWMTGTQAKKMCTVALASHTDWIGGELDDRQTSKSGIEERVSDRQTIFPDSSLVNECAACDHMIVWFTLFSTTHYMHTAVFA